MGLEVEIVGDRLECSVDCKQLWSTPIASIVLSAEYTTNEGPWLEDWYLVIKFVEEAHLMEVRIHDSVIGGFSVLLQALGPRMHTALDLGLVSSAEWNSRVMWPASLKDEKFFTLDPIAPMGMWEKLRYGCFGAQLSLSLTKPVQDRLRRYETQAKDAVDVEVKAKY